MAPSYHRYHVPNPQTTDFPCKPSAKLKAPLPPSFPAGSLPANPLAMTAGIKTPEILKRPGAYEKLDRLTERLITG